MRFKKVVSPESVHSFESAFSIARGERVISRGIFTSMRSGSRLKRYELREYQSHTFRVTMSVITGSHTGAVPRSHSTVNRGRLGIWRHRILIKPQKKMLKVRQRE